MGERTFKTFVSISFVILAMMSGYIGLFRNQPTKEAFTFGFLCASLMLFGVSLWSEVREK